MVGALRLTSVCDECGVLTTCELKEAGLSDPAIRRALRARPDAPPLLTHERQGWYSTPTADATALSAVRAGGVATCVSAFKFVKNHHVPGLWVPGGTAGVHVRLSKAGRANGGVRSRPGVVFCRGAGRPWPTRHAVDSIPEALSCGPRCVSEEEWIAMCDSALHYTGWTIPDLRAHMQLSAEIRRMMARCNELAESGAESLARVRLEAAGYRVHVQPVIGGRRRADLRVGNLLIEVDSEGHHSGAARRRDIRRDRKTLGKRWSTMRIDNEEVTVPAYWDEVMVDVHEYTADERHRIRRPEDFPEQID